MNPCSRVPCRSGVPVANERHMEREDPTVFESTDAPTARDLQPLLHDVVLCVAAPAFTASPRDGQLRGVGADGFYDHDRRLLRTLCLLLDGREPEPFGVQTL